MLGSFISDIFSYRSAIKAIKKKKQTYKSFYNLSLAVSEVDLARVQFRFK